MTSVAERSPLKEIAFGSVAGMTAKVFEHPFDLVKVRLQSQPTDRAQTFTGPWDCFKQTYTKEGLRGLYRGISAPILGAAFENATLFLIYNRCQNLILALNPSPTVPSSVSGPRGAAGLSEKAMGKRRELTVPELGLAGAGAGAAASFVLTPIELIKCRMQVQMLAREGAFGPSKGVATAATASLSTAASVRPLHTFSSVLGPLHVPVPTPALQPLLGPIALIRDTIRTNGLRGLWLGQIGTFFRETGGSCAWFTAYEVSCQFFLSHLRLDSASTSSSTLAPPTKSDLPAWALMAAGASAGICYNVILFPADSVKSAIQTWAELYPDKPRLGFREMGKRIWTTRGFRGLYAGCGVTVVKTAPSSAMLFWIYETLSGTFG